MAVASKTIVALFLNFLFALGVVLTVIGFVGGIKLVANIVIFDEYPLPAYEDNCDQLRLSVPMIEKVATSSAQQNSFSQEDCEKNIEKRRKVKLVEDLSTNVGLLVSGLALYLLFNPRSRSARALTE